MAIDPKDIRLSLEQKQRLAEVADKNGKQWQDVWDDALERYAQASADTEENEGLDTEYIHWCAEQLQGKKLVDLEEVRQALSTIKGSLADEIIAERDER